MLFIFLFLLVVECWVFVIQYGWLVFARRESQATAALCRTDLVPVLLIRCRRSSGSLEVAPTTFLARVQKDLALLYT